MDRRGFLTGLAGLVALSVLPSNELFAAVAKTATTPEPIVQKRKLMATWTPEFAQDLEAFHSIDAEKELTMILRQEIEREIGQERGEITTRKVLNQDTFEQKYMMTFRNNGKYSAEEMWGLKL